MKRLYSLLAPFLLTALLAPSLEAQTRVARADAPPRQPAPADQVEASRQILAGGARNAARSIHAINLHRQPETPPPSTAPGADTVTEAPGRSKALGVGFLATLPSAGASAIINLSPNTAVQGILGMFLAGYRSVSGRYLYYFREKTNFQPFVYGEVGAWSYDKQTVLGFGGGAGLEYFIERYPFMSVSVEFTMRHIGFTSDVYDVSGLAIGGGLHYYF